ncbi:MAG: Mrp/NBP35 family ATP-binding protein [Candidatus Bipolaricaulota bacterium]|nr:Mrp/NBP35 family ATP-binding protein [Candidatus Bipolaricaulota bacterium]MCS7274600.1 Mrp/NBP35 family ATP-binding protein [Candidatus Bipolaricaulota bacterium]MDW8110969.1 P-loop NTPase [Candidatus Bipolaricaulota bacterium]
MDPRVAIISDRLKSIKKIIAIAAGKGGVGKSTIATGLALVLSQLGYKIGLLDLDFYGPSSHVILGLSEEIQPREERGIVPPTVHGIELMSLVFYTGKNPTPLRGPDLTNALIELLAITRWGDLDFLIVDMPPGMGETTLDAIRFLKNPSFLIVTTPSRVAHETVGKLLALLSELNIAILGVLENMRRSSDRARSSFGVRVVGELPFDEGLEDALGDPERFLQTEFAQRLREIASAIFPLPEPRASPPPSLRL